MAHSWSPRICVFIFLVFDFKTQTKPMLELNHEPPDSQSVHKYPGNLPTREFCQCDTIVWCFLLQESSSECKSQNVRKKQYTKKYPQQLYTVSDSLHSEKVIKYKNQLVQKREKIIK